MCILCFEILKLKVVISLRQLAHDRNYGWSEYWDFLGTSCDLSKPEGLELLEDYFSSQQSSADEAGGVDRESPLFSFVPDNNHSDSSNVSRKLFDEEAVEEAGVLMEVKQTTPPVDEQLVDMFAKKMSFQRDKDCLFISGLVNYYHGIFVILSSVDSPPLNWTMMCSLRCVE